MDLVVGAGRVIVTMTATSSRGEPKVVRECTYPLTAARRRRRRRHGAGGLPAREGGLALTELLGDATLDDVRAATTAPFSWRSRRAMSESTGDASRRGAAGEVDPPYLYHDYVGTRLRRPKDPLVILPATLGD